MSKEKSSQQIKFNKIQALFSVIILLVLYVPLKDMIYQATTFHDYRWLILAFFLVLYVFWNFVRITILMLSGVPAIILSNEAITITEKGYTIAWNDIAAMDFVEGGVKAPTYSLVIEVKDPWKYISGIKNPVMRYYCWYAKDYFYKPFAVSLSIVEGDSFAVFRTVEEYYNQYR